MDPIRKGERLCRVMADAAVLGTVDAAAAVARLRRIRELIGEGRRYPEIQA